MASLINYELLGTGIGLLPEPGGDGHTAIYVGKVVNLSRPLRSCTCRESSRRTCRHLRKLAAGVARAQRLWGGRGFQDFFEGTLWHRLATVLHSGRPPACEVVRVAHHAESGDLVFSDPSGAELMRYGDTSSARLRFLERAGKAPKGEETVDRAEILERLALFQLTPDEYRLRQARMPSNRETWQKSLWWRVAYHAVRELGDEGSFHPAIDRLDGRFILTYRDPTGQRMLEVTVPRQRVAQVLQLLASAFPDQDDLRVRPVPLEALHQVTGDGDLEVEVRPVLRALELDGEERFFEDRERFRYGSLVFLEELGVLAEVEKRAADRPLTRLRLERGQIPSFLESEREAFEDGSLVLAEPLRHLTLFKEIDDLRVDVGADHEKGLWESLAVTCGFADESVALADLIAAREEGRPYFETPAGWVDLHAPEIRALVSLAAGEEELSPGRLLRLKAIAGKTVRLDGAEAGRALLDRLLELRPSEPYIATAGLSSTLRPYQRLGVDWLRFLAENRLGGLLCDDMGLGKTHQAMALMVSMIEQDGRSGPFLVVAPTSVVPHWESKLEEHAPALIGRVYHGSHRRLPRALEPIPDREVVVVTSYGVLLRDIRRLEKQRFTAIVFDEIQNLKNRQTQVARAAARLRGDTLLGLTGTPVENSLDELKNLMDLVLPGYLGDDDEFQERYGGDDVPPQAMAELRRSLAPFVLRRLKSSVLEELPEKFEDLRLCRLSKRQQELYREVIETRGTALARVLRQGEGPVPYLHVFAMLTQLKQICDHPALALRDLDGADRYASGKWDLFRQILDECLDSGHKVVVFSQYLGMIELMRRHLVKLDVGHEILIGSSRDRGRSVERFNHDPECRVFLASLKAGGTGIDLIGATIVIHYDRWWNAAREDQATDRVHRIGQKRAVQVFKLVTEGTLEEKIAALIDRKRQLLEDVVEEDDPRLSKVFTREQLLELIAATPWDEE
ncbi:MAG: DEAD/DEAH box helicase [Acidobacteriota bacterium]